MKKGLSPFFLRERARKIKLVLMDVDGVLTNGTVFHFMSGSELVEFKGVGAQDAIGLVWLADSGIKTGVISGRDSPGLAERLKNLKVSFILQGRLDKKNAFEEIRKAAALTAEEILYAGDDLPDIPVLKAVGLGVAVKNARPEVKAAAAWTTKKEGGKGAAREIAETLLKAQRRWDAVVKRWS